MSFTVGGGTVTDTTPQRAARRGGYKAFCCACDIRIPPKGFNALGGVIKFLIYYTMLSVIPT